MRNKTEIIYQNDSLMALFKPAGILSVPDRYNAEKRSMASTILSVFPDARPLHRLDFETSGVLLFCLQSEAFGWYSDQFEHRTVTKQYTAICDGRILQDVGVIDTPLYMQSSGKVMVAKRGKESLTKWKRLETFKHHSLLEITPMTGRTHQIRVHLASIGHPVTGDITYGSKGPLLLSTLKGKHRYKLSKDAEEERPLIHRVALHASAVSIQDFTTQKKLEIRADLPKDMRVGTNKLRQYSSLS